MRLSQNSQNVYMGQVLNLFQDLRFHGHNPLNLIDAETSSV